MECVKRVLASVHSDQNNFAEWSQRTISVPIYAIWCQKWRFLSVGHWVQFEQRASSLVGFSFSLTSSWGVLDKHTDLIGSLISTDTYREKRK